MMVIFYHSLILLVIEYSLDFNLWPFFSTNFDWFNHFNYLYLPFDDFQLLSIILTRRTYVRGNFHQLQIADFSGLQFSRVKKINT